MKRVRVKKEEKKPFMYTYYVQDGKIKLAKTPEDVKGEIVKEPYATIYDFLISRKEYLTKYPDNQRELAELNLYFAHIEFIIFHDKTI